MSKNSVLSITTALKKSGISKDHLASKLGISVNELNKTIKDCERITLAQINKMSNILNCSPKDLIFIKTTKRIKKHTEEQLSKYFGELWFSVNWIVSIFYEKINYYNENSDLQTNQQKNLFLSAAHHYALILINELWSSSNNEEDDISFSAFFSYALETIDDRFHKDISILKKEFNRFKIKQTDLLRRFKLSRDKTIAHITNYQRKIITVKDAKGVPTIVDETAFLADELKLVINTLVDITNKITKIVNDLKWITLTEIKKFESKT